MLRKIVLCASFKKLTMPKSILHTVTLKEHSFSRYIAMANILYDSDTKACMLYIGSHGKRWEGTKPTSRWLVTIKAKIQQNIIYVYTTSTFVMCQIDELLLKKPGKKKTLRRKCYGHKFLSQSTKGKGGDGD